ncbi:MAG: carboxypeptidase M32 [Gluconacetobacter diazotrophicus]|nr:carboxypeptidase M32 [Gluconacetobacter diazotrophicus]
MNAYARLERRFARLQHLDDALGILGWDKETTMPLGAAEARGEQIATLSVMRHELICASEVADWLDEADGDAGLDRMQAANLREMRRDRAHAAGVPAELVEAASRASTRCEVAWRRARAESDFASLLPTLGEVLDTQRTVAQAKGEALGLAPYDALLDQYDPGLRAAAVEPVFGQLERELPELLGAVLERQRGMASPPPFRGPFPVAEQRALGEELMRALGFDATRGRLDVSTHPFCGGATDDVRITTRYDEADFSSALMGVLHETGHALYEQNRPRALIAQPAGRARGMAMHESQSLLVEMQACRSEPFLRWLAGRLERRFGAQPAFAPDALVAHYRTVRPGLIRVDADEVTYPAHIMLRFRLERAMIAGNLALPDLPAAFGDGMRTLLGVEVPDDRHGCLQDIHWPGGAWGYFPTYTLGAIMAAQLFGAAVAHDPAVVAELADGRFGTLTTWLRRAIHERGSTASSGEILRDATGSDLDAGAFLSHLRSRYLD